MASFRSGADALGSSIWLAVACGEIHNGSSGVPG